MRSVSPTTVRRTFSPCQLGGPPRWPLSHDPESTVGSALFNGRNRAVGMKLYVGNLSYSVTSQGLEELFAPFGQVKSAQVIQDRDTGRSKGFGFVEMVDAN